MSLSPSSSGADAAVVLRDVHKSFGAHKVLAGVDLQAQRGQGSGRVEGFGHALEGRLAGAAPGRQFFGGHEVALQDQLQRALAVAARLQMVAVRERGPPAHRMHAADEAADALQRTRRLQLRLAACAAGG